MITWAFREFENIKLFNKDEEVDSLKIPGSNESLSSISAINDIIVTVPKTKNKTIDYEIKLFEVIEFPIKEKQLIGNLIVKIPKETPSSFGLYSTNQVNRSNLFVRFYDYLYNLVIGLFI